MQADIIHIRNGERVVLYRQDETFVCPICGYAGLWEPPWYEPVPGSPAAPSFEVCPSCEITFGYSDMVPDDFPIGAQRAIWANLRLEWIRGKGAGIDLSAQLQNIGFTRSEAENLHARALANKEPDEEFVRILKAYRSSKGDAPE